jgi:hypothetical protein
MTPISQGIRGLNGTAVQLGYSNHMGLAFQQILGLRGELETVVSGLLEQVSDVAVRFFQRFPGDKKAGSSCLFTNQLQTMFEISGQLPVIAFRRASGTKALPDDVIDGLFFQDNINTMIFDKVKLYGLGLFVVRFNLFKHFFNVGHQAAVSVGDQFNA